MEYCPVTQGSDRARHRTGSYVWQRNLGPGRKHPRCHIFLHFQVLLQELYFWFDKAAEKRKAGVDCCTLCGEEAVAQGPGSNHQPILCNECYYVCYPTLDKMESDFGARWLVCAHLLGRLKASPSCSRHYAWLGAKSPPRMRMQCSAPRINDWRLVLAVIQSCDKLRRPFRNLRELWESWCLFDKFFYDCKRLKLLEPEDLRLPVDSHGRAIVSNRTVPSRDRSK